MKYKISEKIHLIGHGYWGKKILSTLQNIAQEPIIIFDKAVSPGVTHIDQLDEFLSQLKSPHFFFVSTPEQTHFSLVKKLLQSNQHVFVEKPLSLTKVEAKELIKLANKYDFNLFVDRIFLYDRGYQLVKKLITENRIGQINKIESTRHSEHIYKPDISVFDDLAPHDIYLAKDLFIQYPQVNTIQVLQKQNVQITEAKITWRLKNIEWTNWYSWNAYPTERTLTVQGKKGQITWKKGKIADEIIVQLQGKEDRLIVNKEKSTLELVIQDFLNTSIQETNSKRKDRYQEYIDEIAVLESIRVQSSSL